MENDKGVITLCQDGRISTWSRSVRLLVHPCLPHFWVLNSFLRTTSGYSRRLLLSLGQWWEMSPCVWCIRRTVSPFPSRLLVSECGFVSLVSPFSDILRARSTKASLSYRHMATSKRDYTIRRYCDPIRGRCERSRGLLS